jgi:GntR family transcriptional regulator
MAPASPPSGSAAPTLRVDLASPVPPYEQLRAQVAGLIATGDLQAGMRLPSVRQLAADLGLAGGTVARAYHELELSGLVEGRGRHGTLVRPGPAASAEERSRQQALAPAVEQLARTAHELGLTEDVTVAAVRHALARLRPQQT